MVSISIKDLLCGKRFRKITTLGCFIQLFNILGGYNSIYFYSNFILESEGLNPGLSRIVSMGLGLVSFCFLFIAHPIIDVKGRKPLLLSGFTGMTVSMIVLGICALYDFPIYVQILLLVVFLFFQSHGPGPVGWVVCGEILNLNGIVIACVVNWLCLTLLGISFPFAVDGIQIYGVFWIFAVINFAGFWFILLYAPETKGLDKREIAKMLQSKN